ncbi:MAG: RHS repeat-associated core domain-containing protein [Paludibacteraceae bacterium]|nr:RHS repeat-associated core domain-containing protein [Paludibacteraceae bacterium]
MNRSSSTYCHTTSNITSNGAISCSTFTGKERDEETGYGYFGARYMDHELTTMWLSVDPMSDKYPSLSPYNYCAWNPVKLVDPDGRKIKGVSYDSQTGSYSFSQNAIRNGADRFVNELSKTHKGQEILHGLIQSSQRYKVRLFAEPLFEERGGSYLQLSGLYLRGNKTLYISTSDRIKADGNAISGYVLKEEGGIPQYGRINSSRVAAGYESIPAEFMDAYSESGMDLFDRDPQNAFSSVGAKINAVGVHEGTHALQNKTSDEKNNEIEALQNEIETRKQYQEL